VTGPQATARTRARAAPDGERGGAGHALGGPGRPGGALAEETRREGEARAGARGEPAADLRVFQYPHRGAGRRADPALDRVACPGRGASGRGSVREEILARARAQVRSRA